MGLRNKRIENIPEYVWSFINQIDHLKGQWIGGAKLNPQALGRLKRSVLVTSTGASTRIEGSKLSDEDVEKFMRGLSLQKFTDRDKQEVQGYFELLENVFTSWKHIPFTEGVIKQLHRELLKYADKDERHRGEYKKIENSVEMFDESGKSVGVIFETVPAYLTPKRVEELVEQTADALKQSESHPLVIIGSFLVKFLAIHPFKDANGRMSRALTNLLLLRAGYGYVPYVSLDEIIEQTKAEYYLSLRATQKRHKTGSEDITPWARYLLNALTEQAERARHLMENDQPEKILSEKQMEVYRLFDDGKTLGVADVVALLQGNMQRETIKQALSRLVKLKLLERIGQARSTRYKKVA